MLIGIIRCDMIAESVIAAAQYVGDVPVVVRLQGTNAEIGQQMVRSRPVLQFWPFQVIDH
jgi:succinyl-CoA synthetase beta subunit